VPIVSSPVVSSISNFANLRFSATRGTVFKNIHDCRNWIGPLVLKEKRSWITREGKFSNGYPTSNLAVLNVDKSFGQAPGRAPDELEGHIRDSPPLGEGG
jgi:hypothetical protein